MTLLDVTEHVAEHLGWHLSDLCCVSQAFRRRVMLHIDPIWTCLIGKSISPHIVKKVKKVELHNGSKLYPPLQAVYKQLIAQQRCYACMGPGGKPYHPHGNKRVLVCHMCAHASRLKEIQEIMPDFINDYGIVFQIGVGRYRSQKFPQASWLRGICWSRYSAISQ